MSKVASARAAQNRAARSVAPIPFTLRQNASTSYDQGEVSCGLLMHFHAAAESLWAGNVEASQWKLAVTESETNLLEDCDSAECREFAVSLASSARDVTTSKVLQGERFECGGMNEADLRAFFGMFDTLRTRMRAAGLNV